ncbi:MAG: hypothetical protein K1X64_16670 [Myxococcaceae bacterium]|nr:hypothetical protein [Myxococcaceae bacterium]
MPTLEELAECLNTYLPLGENERRVERPGWVLYLGAGGNHPAFTVVQRFYLGDDEVDVAVEEIRGLLEQHGRKQSTWEIGPSSTPSNLVDRLLTLGLKRYEEPVATGMVLRKTLTIKPGMATARKAETVDDYVHAFEILNTVFKEREESNEARRARAEKQLQRDRAGSGAMFLALLQDYPVAAGGCVHVDDAVVLGGAATLEQFRGHGAYHALTRVRYQHAVQRGAEGLVIQAGAMSKPILEKVGFESVAEVQLLIDGA